MIGLGEALPSVDPIRHVLAADQVSLPCLPVREAGGGSGRLPRRYNIRRRFNGSRPESARSPVKGSSARSNLLTSASSKVIATFLASASATATRDDSNSSLMVMRSPANFTLVPYSISNSIVAAVSSRSSIRSFNLFKRPCCSAADETDEDDQCRRGTARRPLRSSDAGPAAICQALPGRRSLPQGLPSSIDRRNEGREPIVVAAARCKQALSDCAPFILPCVMFRPPISSIAR